MRTVLLKFIPDFLMFFFTLPCYNVYILFHKLKHEKKPHLHVGRIRWCSWSCCEPPSNSCSAHTSDSSPGPKKILGQTTTYIHLYFTTKIYKYNPKHFLFCININSDIWKWSFILLWTFWGVWQCMQSHCGGVPN